MRCAVCGSTRIVTETRKEGYNLKKGIVGSVLFGGMGAVAGTSGNEVTYYHCGDCGQVLNKCMSDFELKELEFALQHQDSSVFLDSTYKMMEKYPNAGWDKEKIVNAKIKSEESDIVNEENIVNEDEKFQKELIQISSNSKFRDNEFTINELINENTSLYTSKIKISRYFHQLCSQGYMERIINEDGAHFRFLKELPNNYFSNNSTKKEYSSRESSINDNLRKEQIRFEADERTMVKFLFKYKDKFTADDIWRDKNSPFSEYPTIRISAILRKLEKKSILKSFKIDYKTFYTINEDIYTEILNILTDNPKNVYEIRNESNKLKDMHPRLIDYFCQQLVERKKAEQVEIEGLPCFFKKKVSTRRNTIINSLKNWIK